MIGAILSALTWLLGRLFGSREPVVAQKAAEAATAETQLKQEQAANEVLRQGAAARAGADARVVRDIAASSPNDALKRDFPQDFRD